MGGRDSIEIAIGHRFRDPALLQRALTHRSWVYEGNRSHGQGDYEAMEFLGDAVLGYLVAEMIYRIYPEWSEGEMSRLRAALVNERSLGEIAERLAFGEHLRLGRGERESGGGRRRSILADVFEAVLAAVYLDGGIRSARAFVRRQFAETVRQTPDPVPQAGDFKTRLQELVQIGGGQPPLYRPLSEQGPPHQRTFEIEVELRDGRTFRGSGGSKKQAEQCAAEAALRALESAAGGIDLDPAPPDR